MQSSRRPENSSCRSFLVGVLCKIIIIIKTVGDFYERQNCFMDYIALMKESYTRACNTKISNVNIAGYFNFNMSQNVTNKMSELILEYYHNYDVACGSELSPCNKIDKTLVVYRFSGNVMRSIMYIMTKL